MKTPGRSILMIVLLMVGLGSIFEMFRTLGRLGVPLQSLVPGMLGGAGGMVIAVLLVKLIRAIWLRLDESQNVRPATQKS